DEPGLLSALSGAAPGATIALAPGTYAIATPILIKTAGLTLRSMSGDASSVVLDGGGTTTPAVRADVSGVTIASLTIAHSANVGVLFQAPASGDVANDRVYDVTFYDNV